MAISAMLPNKTLPVEFNVICGPRHMAVGDAQFGREAASSTSSGLTPWRKLLYLNSPFACSDQATLARFPDQSNFQSGSPYPQFL